MGEVLMRCQAPLHTRLMESNQLTFFYGGAEANTSVALSHLGHDVTLYTALPKDHPMGDGAIADLMKHGVSNRAILRKGERIGLYYVEQGFFDRPSEVYYDRKHSSFLELAHANEEWESLFSGQDWFHFTGVTPALSPEIRNLSIKAIQTAKKLGLTTSFDFNFRSKLWSKEDAAEYYKMILPYVDHCFAGWKDFTWIFDWEPEGETYEEQLSSYYGRLESEYGIASVSSTNRRVQHHHLHDLTGYTYSGGRMYTTRSKEFEVLDRIGGGDSFAAGIIHGLSHQMEMNEALEYALSLSVLNHYLAGDHNAVSNHNVLSYMNKSSNDISR